MLYERHYGLVGCESGPKIEGSLRRSASDCKVFLPSRQKWEYLEDVRIIFYFGERRQYGVLFRDMYLLRSVTSAEALL